MCIAIYSNIGTEIPARETLKNCYEQNPHGCGFSFSFDNSVYIFKGFFDFDEFYEKLTECNKTYRLRDQAVLLHFRIMTHGKLNADNCHPFPITHKESELKASFVKCDYSIVHNGIVSCCANESKNSNFSDTAIFVRDYLSRIASFKRWYKNPNLMPLIEKMIGSKMAILCKDGTIKATSGFHKGEDENYYSNYSYKDNKCNFYGYPYFRDWYCLDDVDSDDVMKIDLMELKPGEVLYYDDDSVEEYDSCYHALYRTFVSEDGEIYSLFEDNVFEKEIPMEFLSYVGNGFIFNSMSPLTPDSIAPLDFRKDAVAIV